MANSTKALSNVDVPAMFMPAPESFKGAHPELRQLIKVGLNVDVDDTRTRSTRIRSKVVRHALLMDLRAVPTEVDLDKASRDCDLIREIIATQPKKLRALLKASQTAVKNNQEDMTTIAKLAQNLGFTEESFAKRGGGLLWVIALVLLAGCAHCNPYRIPDKRP